FVCKSQQFFSFWKDKKAGPAGGTNGRPGALSISAVAAAAVAALMMGAVVAFAVRVMGAHGVGVVLQAARQQGLHRLVGAALCAGIQLDAGLCQRGARAAADTAADQGVHPALGQQTGQCAVAALAGADDLAGDHLAVFHIVYLKLFGMAEVLEHQAVFIGDCNAFHWESSFSLWQQPHRRPPQGWAVQRVYSPPSMRIERPCTSACARMRRASL